MHIPAWMSHPVKGYPPSAIYFELLLAAWVVVQVLTGRIIRRTTDPTPVLRRKDMPGVFWFGISLQALIIAAGLSLSLGSSLVGILFFIVSLIVGFGGLFWALFSIIKTLIRRRRHQ